MFIHMLKSLSVARSSGNTNGYGLEKILITMLNIDVWILTNIRKCFKKIIRVLKPILDVLFIMCFGAGLLLIYGFIYVPNNNYFDHRSPRKSGEIVEITDASHYDTSFVEKELVHLRNKAHNLEISLRKMNFKLQSICNRGKISDENLPDFASEAAGGAVIGTPDTESFYQSNQIQATIFGIPIWRPSYFTPRKIIQPWTQAGECWAFRGNSGNIEIELAHLALLDRVTLEHIPVSASLTGSIDSAPREFRVLGKFRNKYLLLGTFVYNQGGPISQTFHITNNEMEKVPFKIIMLQILSNWGNSEFTCIYRFKVHGKIYDYYDD